MGETVIKGLNGLRPRDGSKKVRLAIIKCAAITPDALARAQEEVAAEIGYIQKWADVRGWDVEVSYVIAKDRVHDLIRKSGVNDADKIDEFIRASVEETRVAFQQAVRDVFGGGSVTEEAEGLAFRRSTTPSSRRDIPNLPTITVRWECWSDLVKRSVVYRERIQTALKRGLDIDDGWIPVGAESSQARIKIKAKGLNDAADVSLKEFVGEMGKSLTSEELRKGPAGQSAINHMAIEGGVVCHLALGTESEPGYDGLISTDAFQKPTTFIGFLLTAFPRYILETSAPEKGSEKREKRSEKVKCQSGYMIPFQVTYGDELLENAKLTGGQLRRLLQFSIDMNGHADQKFKRDFCLNLLDFTLKASEIIPAKLIQDTVSTILFDISGKSGLQHPTHASLRHRLFAHIYQRSGLNLHADEYSPLKTLRANQRMAELYDEWLKASPTRQASHESTAVIASALASAALPTPLQPPVSAPYGSVLLLSSSPPRRSQPVMNMMADGRQRTPSLMNPMAPAFVPVYGDGFLYQSKNPGFGYRQPEVIGHTRQQLNAAWWVGMCSPEAYNEALNPLMMPQPCDRHYHPPQLPHGNMYGRNEVGHHSFYFQREPVQPIPRHSLQPTTVADGQLSGQHIPYSFSYR